MNTETENGTALTFDRSGQAMFPELTAGVSEHLVRTSPSQENEQGLTETDQALSERCFVFLANLKKKTDPNGLSTRMLRECCRQIEGGTSFPSSWQWKNSGTISNGICSTASITEYPRTGRECILSDILEDVVPEKYFLSKEQMEKIVFTSASSDTGTATDEIHKSLTNEGGVEALDTAAGGGRGHHTAVPVFGIDNSKGGQERDIANALTTRNNLNGVSNVKQDGTAVCIPVLTPERIEKRQNGRRFKDDGEPSFTLTSQDRHGVALGINTETDGTSRTIKAQYAKSSLANFVRSDSLGATGAAVEISGYEVTGEKDTANCLNANDQRKVFGAKQPRTMGALKIKSATSCNQGIFVTLENNVNVYAVWYEKYQCYIAIRKLTPLECFRLQGWSDDYFEKAQFVNSDSQLYKQAGNGVTVNVVELIGKAIAEQE